MTLFDKRVRHTAEIDRILALPRRSQTAQEFGESIAEELTELLRKPNGTQTLRAIQAAGLYEAGTCGGLFGPISVGHGKTILSLLVGYVLDAKRIILVLPAGLVEKTKRDMRLYAEHWLIPDNIEIISYEMLGRVQWANYLEEEVPDLLVFDEVQKLKNRRAAVTKRISRFMRKYPTTKVVALTGTPMKKSILNFGHILRWCLKENAPIPTSDVELEEWAFALDEKMEEWERYEPGGLTAFSNGSDDLEDVRRGFRDRLISTPGVVAVATGEDDLVEAGLEIRALKYDVSPTTDKHFKRLREDMVTPDDWQLMQAVDVWRHSRELSLGFHYCWVERTLWGRWLAPILKNAKNKPDDIVQKISNVLEPMTVSATSTGALSVDETRFSRLDTALSMASTTDYTPNKKASVPFATRSLDGREKLEGSALITITERGKSEDFCASPATEQLGFSEIAPRAYRELLSTCLKLAKPPEDWRFARREWNAFVREVLSRSRTLDSELQVVQACDSGRLPNDKLEAWRAIKDTFTPNVVAMWHDDAALKVCRKWMQEPGIVWTEHDLFARRLAEFTGCRYYGAKGLTDQGDFIDDASPREAVILSIAANKEGRNLQEKWYRNLITALPEGADVLQQMLGRTHRPKQIADTVEVDILLGCKEHANAWRRALAAAVAIRDTTGAESKLLLAEVDWPSDDEIAGYAGARWR